MTNSQGLHVGRIELTEEQADRWLENVQKSLTFELDDGTTRTVKVTGENIHTLLALLDAVDHDRTRITPGVVDGTIKDIYASNRYNIFGSLGQQFGWFEMSSEYDPEAGFVYYYDVDGQRFTNMKEVFHPEVSRWGTIEVFLTDPE